MGRPKRAAFAVVEYAIFIAVLCAALVGMAISIRRALSDKWRQAGDAFGHGRQYEPGLTTVSP